MSDLIDKQGGQRRGLVDKAIEVVAGGVEEFIDQIGKAVTLCVRCDCIEEEEDCHCGSGRQAGLKSDQVSLKDFLLV